MKSFINMPQITSPTFPRNGMIPSKFTCDGANVSPPLSIANIPEKTMSLALIVDDPDAPVETWVHWVVWNVAAGTKETRGGISGQKLTVKLISG